MSQKGKIVVLVAPSGSGKSSIAKYVLSSIDNLVFSVSATTRPTRPGEQDGIEYYFISKEEFNKRIENEDFLEWEEFYKGKRYGTLKSDVEEKLNSGYFCLLDIEIEGAMNVKQMYGDDCLAIFVKPPSLEVLEQRLRDRGTETEQTLRERLDRAKKEITYQDKFDVVVINDKLDQAQKEAEEIIRSFMNNSQ
jgi:guanylate kinase